MFFFPQTYAKWYAILFLLFGYVFFFNTQVWYIFITYQYIFKWFPTVVCNLLFSLLGIAFNL